MASRRGMSYASLNRALAAGPSGAVGRPRPIRRAPGAMNSWERAYADKLELLRISGVIVSWSFEPMSFRLARKTFYHPDFMVITPAEVQFHEVKAVAEDDARAKWKIAAELHPWARWVWAQRRSAKEPWAITEYRKEA